MPVCIAAKTCPSPTKLTASTMPVTKVSSSSVRVRRSEAGSQFVVRHELSCVAVSTELIVILVGGLLGLGLEVFIWQMEWLWHEKAEPKRDPRSTRPPF